MVFTCISPVEFFHENMVELWVSVALKYGKYVSKNQPWGGRISCWDRNLEYDNFLLILRVVYISLPILGL